MTPVLRALVLGVVQGLTEFIPVSSSGHLILVPELFGWSDPGLAFDVALHLGTLLAVLVYFRSEWWAAIRGFFSSFKVKPARWDSDQRLAWLIIAATIPAAAAGLALESLIEDHLRSAGVVAAFLLAGAAAMSLAEIFSRRTRDFDALKPRDAGSMGLSQVLALAPGMSRSGVTMSAGMFTGLRREAAARFSFMMAGPVIGGAGIVEAVKLAREGLVSCTWGMIITGFVASAAVGVVTIRYLLKYLKRRSLWPFVAYSAAVAAATFIVIGVS